ncbi:MAG: hypothetical protein C4527_09395 [Candidatus Omnitrophota bacterium]|jgi:hypothetical protein|nr:MAG: hypothetical protein C4527_09395 [Candidatus Omnitrophota bacterium]
MKTAQDVIMEIQELPPEEKQIVVDFVASIQEETYNPTYYSPEDMAKIDHDMEEAEQGINVSGPFYTTEEILAHLDSLKPEE